MLLLENNNILRGFVLGHLTPSYINYFPVTA